MGWGVVFGLDSCLASAGLMQNAKPPWEGVLIGHYFSRPSLVTDTGSDCDWSLVERELWRSF